MAIPLYPGARPLPLNIQEKPMYIGASNMLIPSPTTDQPDGVFSNGNREPLVQEDVSGYKNDNEPLTSPKHKSTVIQAESHQHGKNIDDKASYTNLCCSIRTNGGYNKVLFYSLGHFLAAFFFLLAINLSILPNLLYPTIGNLLPLNILSTDPRRAVVLIVLWGLHFTRRFAETLFVHVYESAQTLLATIGNLIYLTFFGIWIGWSINYHIDYLTPPNYIFIPGIVICVIGECGNFICHMQLRAFRKSRRFRNNPNYYCSKITKHMVPTGGCFNLVSFPHYLFELITWIGFATAAFTLAAWTFCVFSAANLIILAYRKHSFMKTEFNGQYGIPQFPNNKKALIPFIF